MYSCTAIYLDTDYLVTRRRRCAFESQNINRYRRQSITLKNPVTIPCLTLSSIRTYKNSSGARRVEDTNMRKAEHIETR